MVTQDNAEWVPESLDTMDPGHEMACMLSAINVDNCTGYDRIRVLKAHEKMRAFYSAQLYQDIAAVADAVDAEDMTSECVEESAAAEVAAALKWTRRTADSEMGFAIDLRDRLPQVWQALIAGDIDERRAKVLVAGTTHLPEDTAREVVASIIDRAHRYTTGQLHARLRRLCLETDPDEAASRYEHAVEQRRVSTQADESGTAHLFGIDLPPHRLAAGMKRIDDLAKSLRRPGETRSIDQLRADVLLDLLEGTGVASDSGRGTVIIHTTLESLAELTDHPGELAGYGPVVADISRQLAAQQHTAEWRWVVEDPETQQPLAIGTTRRRPNTEQRRLVETRNPTCIHPGCRMPAMESDIDHTDPWSHGGRTDTGNLAPLCRHHHRLKEESGWSYRPVANGDYVFTTPLGHAYTTSGRSP
ncbi:MAG: DUF222 domain-containing protein [Acidimicrobiia bacterium]|nr:DUF222 domain-containing protein [Acidimicrobiia bacterium]